MARSLVLLFKALDIGEGMKLVHLISVEVELAIVALDASISAAVWNENCSVALVESAEHGVVHATSSN